MRMRDRGWKKFGSGINDNHPGSATLLPTPRLKRTCLYQFCNSLQKVFAVKKFSQNYLGKLSRNSKVIHSYFGNASFRTKSDITWRYFYKNVPIALQIGDFFFVFLWTLKQCCGFGLCISSEYGYGSGYGSRFRVLMTKNWKKYSRKFFFLSKVTIDYL